METCADMPVETSPSSSFSSDDNCMQSSDEDGSIISQNFRRMSEPVGYAFHPKRRIPLPAPCDDSPPSPESMVCGNEIEVLHTEDRTKNTDWCSCSNCSVIPSMDECKCCKEITEISHRMAGLKCILEHEKFDTLCLDTDVLEIGLLSMRELRAESLIRPICTRHFVFYQLLCVLMCQ